MIILTLGQLRPESHSNNIIMNYMKKEILKSAAEPQYEAPAVAVLEIQNEGVLCASAQEFEEETDWVW